MDSAPTVPKRNDPPKGVNVYSRSRAEEISGKDPNCHYEWASTNPDHPQYAGKKLRRHEIGGPGNYAMCEPWEIVPSDEIEQGRKRADESKRFDTATRNGSLVLLKTSKENAALYETVNNNAASGYTKGLAQGHHGGTPGYTRTKVRAEVGNMETGAERAEFEDVLNGGT
jgi:hypothetical protein